MTSHRRDLTIALLFAALLVGTTGCAPVYVPNTVHAPTLEEQGDVQLGGYFGSSGIDLQVAGAVSDHVGLMGDVSIARQEEGNEGGELNDNFHRHEFGEVGVGYFTPVGSRGNFSIYSGFGFGSAEAVDNYEFVGSNVVKASGNYNRLFLQPSMELSAGPLRLLGALRMSRVHFGEFETNRQTFSTNETEFFLEPAVGLSLGSSTVQFDTQLGISNPVAPAEEVAFDHEPLWLSLGIQFNFD